MTVAVLAVSTTVVSTGIGQALLFLLVATIGFILNRKSKQIHVLVNGRLDEVLKDRIELRAQLVDALKRIGELEEHELHQIVGPPLPTDTAEAPA